MLLEASFASNPKLAPILQRCFFYDYDSKIENTK